MRYVLILFLFTSMAFSQNDINESDLIGKWEINIKVKKLIKEETKKLDMLEKLAAKLASEFAEDIVNNIDNYFWNSNNKQLIDQAGQTFGRLGDLKRAKKFLERSIQLDPNSPNALLSLAITFHISRDLENEKPIILKLLELTPENPQVLRLGVQVAGILKDKEMSNQVLSLMTKHNKEALPLAKKFIDNAFKTN